MSYLYVDMLAVYNLYDKQGLDASCVPGWRNTRANLSLGGGTKNGATARKRASGTWRQKMAIRRE